jgi:hypothetical protein
VRALGAFEQRPGCPDFVHAALDAKRIESLCLGECFHPGETRKPIERIEVVRIRPGADRDASVAQRIEDPWRVFVCDRQAEGCVVEFDDPEYGRVPVETAYYVRAIQAVSDAVNGDPLRCTRDAQGRCLSTQACPGDERGPIDDCLDPVGERAWSSPIFVVPSGEGPASAQQPVVQTLRERSPQ